MSKNILITGAAGFIGSHVLRLMVHKYPNYNFVNLDLLTYAGNLENTKDLESLKNYTFVKGDICSEDLVTELFEKHQINGVIHLAAESHVDRSIEDPMAFIQTNVLGAVNLLNVAKTAWKGDFEGKLFYHVSTDEVYGSLGKTGLFTETTSYDPRSPYSASKASSDHLVRAWYRTYGLPVLITNCSNNYGPFQFPEKFIPLVIINCLQEKKLPVYGTGSNIRDWLHVNDHCKALEMIGETGSVGQTYMLGGNSERTNLEIVTHLCQILNKSRPKADGKDYIDLIEYVNDRPGHDLRYAIDISQTTKDIGWEPLINLETGLFNTVRWYLDHKNWWQDIINRKYDGERLGLNRAPNTKGKK